MSGPRNLEWLQWLVLLSLSLHGEAVVQALWKALDDPPEAPVLLTLRMPAAGEPWGKQHVESDKV